MEFLTTAFMGTPVWMWLSFLATVAALLAADLGLLHKGAREIGVRESLAMSAVYVALGVTFSGFIFWQMGAPAAASYLTAFVVEKSLSMDNVFVMALIFSSLAIPRALQHRVLFWGVLGVIVLRGLMIAIGATLVAEYHWVLYLFAGFLILTGIKMLFAREEHAPIDTPILRWLKSRLRLTERLEGESFFVRREGLWFATPLFLALIMVETADLIFAVDSVPAVFAITADPFLVYTSNIFAILGLRALHFALSAILHRFAYLKYALAGLLVFIGSKMFIADWLDWEKFPAGLSLGITAAILTSGIAVSLWKTRRVLA
ncbi:TerC/Alx family metal homeostasis membrane protein [bacterium]|nr:TerC/Alx family metal homeostasis membrane protein [bacterium]